MKKLMTVVIPAYNVEKYLSRCLDSLTYDADVLDKLEIIVVNDGGTDGTLALAQTYASEFPETISVIDKENGGHGSTINVGLKAAHGKYFRVVDSDDWVNIDDFGKFVKSLESIDTDILVSNYNEDHLYDGSVRRFIFRQPETNVEKTIGTIVDLIDGREFFFEFSMHSITVKTAALKKVWGDGLLENTFYVDQQYVAKVLECAKNYLLTEFNIYRYFIGRPEQSVGMEGFWRHRQDHEKVLRWLLEEQSELEDTSPIRQVLQKQIALMLQTHYEIYYQRFDATDIEIKELLRFDVFLRDNFGSLHQEVPAARNIGRRLVSWRRKVKQRLLQK